MNWGGVGLRGKLAWGLERFLGVHVYLVRVRPLDLPVPSRASVPQHIQIRRAVDSELETALQNPSLGISASFLSMAQARGDRCYGAFDDGQLVAYVWRSTGIANHERGVGVSVSAPYVYGYKGFTSPSHRGLGLNVALVAFAGSDYLDAGYRHLAAFVALYNRSSLANSKENGFSHVGYAGYVRWFGTVLPFRTLAPRRIGFSFVGVDDA